MFRQLQTTLLPEELQTLRWLSSERETPGWDIQFKSKSGDLIRIEVKGTSAKKFVNVEVTAGEWNAAREHRSGYWLYLVAQCTGRAPIIQRICDPYKLYEENGMTATPIVWRLEMNE